MSMATVGSDGISNDSLADRVLSIVSKRGSAGIIQDELLRKIGVGYDQLMTAVDELVSRELVRVH